MKLVVDRLACRRSGRPVFAGVSFALSAGEALLVTGRNGAGKSSLLRILAGLLAAEAGSARLDGGTHERTLPEEAHLLGHRDAVKAALTPVEALLFWQAMLGRPRLAPEAALERLDLGHAADLPCAVLSAGQRRRLALARLLVSERPVWLLDEPTATLDAAGQEAFAALAREHLAGGGLVVAATHAPLGIEGPRELRLEPSPFADEG